MAKEKYYVLFMSDYAEGWSRPTYDTIEEVKELILDNLDYNYMIIKGTEIPFQIETKHNIVFTEEK